MTTKKRKSSKLTTLRGPSQSEEQKWQAEEDVRTLMRADEIKSNRARMARAKRMALEQAKEAAKVAGKIK